MIARRYWIIVLLLTLSNRAIAQVNLVRNGDFEQYSVCPSAYDEIKSALHWASLDTNAPNYGVGIPDYLNICSSDITVRLPINAYGFQYPHSKNGLAQLQVFYDSSQSQPQIREYLQGRLIKKLTAGKSYCVTFYANLVDASLYAIKELGAYLDNGTIDTARNITLPQTMYTPQIINNGGALNDTGSWVKIQGTFIANGTEQFITIGNFRDKAHTTYIQMPSHKLNNGSNYTWYWIDDISVVESATKADAGPDTHIGVGDSVFIGHPDVAMDCTWTKLGCSTIIGTGAGIWVRPNITTSYVVTQTLCGVVTKDTVKVEVWAADVQSINGQMQQYGILPNPNNGVFELVQSVVRDESLQAEVVNAVGQKMLSFQLMIKDGRAAFVKGSDLPPGVYYLSLKTKEGFVWNMRFVRE